MIIVTGGAGFIGSNIVASLAALGDREVAVCDVLDTGDKWKNLAKHEITHFIAPSQLFDFLNSESYRVDAIVHMGAISATTETDADLIIRNNFNLSVQLWDWCAKKEASFIYASSAATYGDGSSGFADDATIAGLAKLRPLNPYGWSKHLFDRRVIRMLADKQPAPEHWAGLKFFNVYGPNEYHKGGQTSVALQIHDQIILEEPVRLFRSHNPAYPDGGQKRDFIYVEDCVSVVRWLLDEPEVNGIFNCGTGEARSFHDLATAVAGALNEPLNVEFVDTPEAIRDRYQYFTEAKMDKLYKAGYSRPFTPLEEGVRRYVEDYLSKPDIYR